VPDADGQKYRQTDKKTDDLSRLRQRVGELKTAREQGAGSANSGAYYSRADAACGLDRSAYGLTTSVSTP